MAVRCLAGIAFASLMGWGQLSASVVLVDFESIAAGAPASNFLSSYGIGSVTTGGGGVPMLVWSNLANMVMPPGTNCFTPSGGAYPAPAFPSAPDYFYTDLNFDVPVTYFSFYRVTQDVPTYGSAGWQAVAYDALNNVVATAGVGLVAGLDYPPPASPVQYTLSGASDITKVRFRVNYTYQSTSATVFLDNFEFNTTPEPSRMILAGFGFCAMLLRRRRSLAAA